MSRDIIVHYDEVAGKIVCSTVDPGLTAPLLAKALPLEMQLEDLKTKTPDEAERAFGAGIFALLDLSSQIKTGIRDYSSDTTKWEIDHAEELEQRSVAGDPSAQYELAMEIITQGLRAKSKKKMNEADVLLRRAVAAGHVEAAEYLAELWPALKDRSDRSFK